MPNFDSNVSPSLPPSFDQLPDEGVSKLPKTKTESAPENSAQKSEKEQREQTTTIYSDAYDPLLASLSIKSGIDYQGISAGISQEDQEQYAQMLEMGSAALNPAHTPHEENKPHDSEQEDTKNLQGSSSFFLLSEDAAKITQVDTVTARIAKHTAQPLQAHEQLHLFAQGVGVTIDVCNLPIIALQILELKNELDDINQKIEQKQKQIEDLPIHEEKSNTTILHKELAGLRKQEKKLKAKIVEVSFNLAKSTVSTASEATSYAAASEKLIGKVPPAHLAVGGAIGVGSANAIFSAATAMTLYRNGRDYHTLKSELKEKKEALNTLHTLNEADRKQLQAEINELQERMSSLRDSIVINSIGATTSLASVLSSGAQAALVSGATLSQHATTVLSHGAAAGTAISGAGVMLISGYQIKNNVETESKMLKELTNLQQDLTNASPIVRSIIQLKFRNLEYQDEANLVDALKNGITLGSGAFGATAGVIAFVGATGTIAAVGTTAGIAAVALAGTAIAVGGGYFIFRNRQVISNNAQTKYSQATELAIGANAKITEARQSLAEYKVAALKEKIHDEQIINFDTMNTIYSQRIDEISSYIASLEEAESIGISPSEQKNQLHSLIEEMKGEIKTLATERTRLSIERAADHERNVYKLADQRETVSKMKQLSEKLAQQRSDAEEKSNQLRSSYENFSLSGQLSQVSPEEVSVFKESLSASLQDPENAKDVREFIQSKGIEIKNEDLLKAVVAYLTKKV